MTLLDLTRGDNFTIDGDDEQVYRFDHIDGLYSVCYTYDDEIVHVSAFAPVHLAF